MVPRRSHAHLVAARAVITVLRERPLAGALDVSTHVRLSAHEKRDLEIVLKFAPYRAALSALTTALRTSGCLSAGEAGRILARRLPGVPVLVTGPGRRTSCVRRLS